MLIGGSGTLLIFINMKDYRRLTEDEVLQLKSQSCLADDWGNVSVAEGFNCEYVHHTRFSGEVKLGVFDAEFTLPGGIRKHSGLRHVTLHNVTVGDKGVGYLYKGNKSRETFEISFGISEIKALL